MVCKNGEVGRRKSKLGDYIGEVEEYKYLEVTMEGDKMVVSNAWDI